MAYLKCILFLQLLCQTGDGHVAGSGSAAPPFENQVPDDRGDGDGREKDKDDDFEKDHAPGDGGDGDEGEEEDEDFETAVGKPEKRKNSNEKKLRPPSKKLSVGGGVKAAQEPG
jgi:hypothetical protein